MKDGWMKASSCKPWLRVLAIALALSGAASALADAPLPHLRKQGTATQLIVDQQPFLVLGGELHNSSASSLPYLEKLWPALTNVNTVLAPVEWDQIEPTEGHFDFTVLDGMLRQARVHNKRLILLWFGAWKNSMSTYMPAFVKHDNQRFPRARNRAGEPQDILSPFSAQTLAADEAAFSAMMRHLKQADPQRTVIMVQVENEIGMLPDVRDYSPAADAAFQGSVPQPLLAYLQANRAGLHPMVRKLWEARGARDAGSWGEVFGDSVEAQEVFQAWYYAAFTDRLAAAGKAAYPLPLFVNVALNRPGKKPGQYPSAGPLPHLFDIWKAGAPAIDILAIDTYFSNYQEWARLFKRPDNPFFVPEGNRIGRPELGANAFFSIGELDAIGYSPFGIEDLKDNPADSIPPAYALLKQMTPLIMQSQGKGIMRGFKAAVSYDGVVDPTPAQARMGAYQLEVSFASQWGKTESAEYESRGGLVIQTGENEFVIAGKGITVTFRDPGGAATGIGIEKATEGSFVDGAWRDGRWMNGDQTHQGRHIRLPGDAFSVQKVRLYKFR
jgi:beta-galactosidase GanA